MPPPSVSAGHLIERLRVGARRWGNEGGGPQRASEADSRSGALPLRNGEHHFFPLFALSFPGALAFPFSADIPVIPEFAVAPSAPVSPSDSRKAWRFLGVSALARELSSWPGRNALGCAATIRRSRHGALAVPHSSTPRPRLSFPFGVLSGMQFFVCSSAFPQRQRMCFLGFIPILGLDSSSGVEGGTTQCALAIG